MRLSNKAVVYTLATALQPYSISVSPITWLVAGEAELDTRMAA